jgi:hypothetical protein
MRKKFDHRDLERVLLFFDFVQVRDFEFDLLLVERERDVEREDAFERLFMRDLLVDRFLDELVFCLLFELAKGDRDRDLDLDRE